MVRKIVLSLVILSLNGCALAGANLLYDMLEEREQASHTTQEAQLKQVDRFQALLEDGWDLHVIDGKLVLVKFTKDGNLLIEDVFHALNR